jgi:asparagine synthase (glutamine-hydrolysing)
MCGILGHLAFRPDARISEVQLKSLNQLLHHRGPDSQGIYLNDSIALGMTRLSIIDLPGGNQPIFSDDSRYVIIFNGEIYNHNELRKDLLKKNYPIFSRSDTEVLLYSFIEYGPDCLQKLNGMFAFAIWDNLKKEVFIARDRLGIKPLYYAFDNKRFMFASELTPIHQSGLFPLQLNYKAISDYLAYWYICEPETIFKNIFQLSPGTYSIVKDGEMRNTTYWKIPDEKEIDIGFNDACERILFILEDSIKLRMKVDVPIGTFLSGGIDSGLVTSIAAKNFNDRLKAFLIGFKEKSYSEIDMAHKTAQRHSVEIHSTIIERITPDMVNEVFTAFDEPLGNASFVPTYFLSKRAREHVKVVLTGDGADELFGGYPTYQAPYYQKIYSWIPGPAKKLINAGINSLPVSHKRISLDFRLKQLMKGIPLSYQRAHYSWREVTSQSNQGKLFRKDIWEGLFPQDTFAKADLYFNKAKNLDLKNQLMFVDMNTYLLNDHLRKVDRMSMAHSLEARVPFLDHRMVELAMTLPSKYKVSLFETKKILKSVAEKYLPKEVIYGKKKGLTSPIAGWIHKELKDYINDNLKSGGIIGEVFNDKIVQDLLDDHCSMKKDHSRIIWGLITLQVWGDKLKPSSII